MTQITETVLRDAHQSLIATRLRSRDLLGAAPILDRAGYASLEAWGGATFDVWLRFLGENPWEMLRRIKAAAPRTPIQMLLRGQNLVGYRHYADDVLDTFVDTAAGNGVDVFRVFDALNDTRNMARAIQAVKRNGKHAQGTLAYTTSPYHTTELFVGVARELKAMDVDSLCIKDMAGLITPRVAFELVRSLKRELGLPVALHSHCTSGLAPMAYQAAIDAGVDRLDCAISPLSGGTSQPPTESVAYALKGTDGDARVDFAVLAEAAAYFCEVRERYGATFNPKNDRPDTGIFVSQIPGGMLSNLQSQLRDLKALHLIDEVLAEVPRVRADLGFPPLVTPTSQIVGAQVGINVLTKGRYKVVAAETKNLVRGMYGRTPAPISDEIRQKILGAERPIEGRPADLIEPELPRLRAELVELGLEPTTENLLMLAMSPEAARKFLKGEAKREIMSWETPA